MRSKTGFIISTALFLLFGILIWALLNIDVQKIGPNGSAIGLAALNEFVRDAVGEHMLWYRITGWMGYIGILTASGFAVFGVIQSIKRKSLFKADKSIIILGIFYLIVIAIYLFFETHIINYRPVIINEVLEASFPSTHTMIIVFVMSTAAIQFNRLIKNRVKRKIFVVFSLLIAFITVLGRIISGVHWFTDILGGLLLGFTLVFLFYAITEKLEPKSELSCI